MKNTNIHKVIFLFCLGIYSQELLSQTYSYNSTYSPEKHTREANANAFVEAGFEYISYTGSKKFNNNMIELLPIKERMVEGSLSNIGIKYRAGFIINNWAFSAFYLKANTFQVKPDEVNQFDYFFDARSRGLSINKLFVKEYIYEGSNHKGEILYGLGLDYRAVNYTLSYFSFDTEKGKVFPFSPGVFTKSETFYYLAPSFEMLRGNKIKLGFEMSYAIAITKGTWSLKNMPNTAFNHFSISLLKLRYEFK